METDKPIIDPGELRQMAERVRKLGSGILIDMLLEVAITGVERLTREVAVRDLALRNIEKYRTPKDNIGVAVATGIEEARAELACEEEGSG